MSTSVTERWPLAEAERLALEVMELLDPACERIEIAGSIRRRKETCGDIEIVCIPRIQQGRDMFGEVNWASVDELDMICSHALGTGALEMRRTNGRAAWGSKFKAALYKGFPLDIFSVLQPAQWGVIYLIRTGPAGYSHRLVTPRRMGGMLPEWMRVKDGALWKSIGEDGWVKIVTPEERDVYEALNLPWLPPGGSQMTLTDKRAELLTWFAGEMAAKLELRQYRGDDWREMGLPWLGDRLEEEISELVEAWESDDLAAMVGEAVDVANYAAMIADTARGMLEQKREATDG